MMKRALIIASVVVCLLSCRNRKAEIVEREKAITKEKQWIDDSIQVLTGYLMAKAFDSRADTVGKETAFRILNAKYANLSKEFDSLEIEYRKY
jgi:hypothetical protein